MTRTINTKLFSCNENVRSRNCMVNVSFRCKGLSLSAIFTKGCHFLMIIAAWFFAHTASVDCFAVKC